MLEESSPQLFKSIKSISIYKIIKSRWYISCSWHVIVLKWLQHTIYHESITESRVGGYISCSWHVRVLKWLQNTIYHERARKSSATSSSFLSSKSSRETYTDQPWRRSDGIRLALIRRARRYSWARRREISCCDRTSSRRALTTLDGTLSS